MCHDKQLHPHRNRTKPQVCNLTKKSPHQGAFYEVRIIKLSCFYERGVNRNERGMNKKKNIE